MTNPCVVTIGYSGDDIGLSTIAAKVILNSAANVSDPVFIVEKRLDSNKVMSTRAKLKDGSKTTYSISFPGKKAASSKTRSILTCCHFDWLDYADCWILAPDSTGGHILSFNPDRCFCNVGRLEFNNFNYTVLANFNSANNADALALWGIYLVNYDEPFDEHFNQNYANKVGLSVAPNIPRKIVDGYEYQARLQDVLIQDGRIFPLFIYVAVDPTVPPELRFIKSELREYKLTLKNEAMAFEVVDTLEIGKNAVNLAYHSHNEGKYLFVPCIGGDQNKDITNGEDSSLSIVKILPNGGFDHAASFDGKGEMRALVGVNGSTDCHDFRSVAIATDGTLFFLCGGHNSNNGFNYRVYKTTAAHLLSNAITGNTSQSPAVPFTLLTDSDLSSSPYIQRQTATSAHFWALGIVLGPDGHEYLLFARGGKNNPSDPVGHDVISFVRVGQPWEKSTTIGLHDDETEINEFTGLADAHGFTLAFLNISVPDRDLPVPLIAAAPPDFAKKDGGATGTEQDEAVERLTKTYQW